MRNTKNPSKIRPALVDSLETRRMFVAASYTLIDLGKNVNVNDIAGNLFVGDRPSSGNSSLSVAYVASVNDPLKPTLLAPGSGYTQSAAYGVRANGDVVGVSYGTNQAPSLGAATLWSGGKTINLGAGVATAISTNGMIVGTSFTSNSFQAARFFTNAAPTLLGVSDEPNSVGSSAADVNANGTIVGSVTRNNSGSTGGFGFSYANGSFFDLTFQGGGTVGEAQAINNAGSITGEIDNKAFFTSGSNIVQYLSTPTGVTSIGRDINASGQIVGEINNAPALWENNTAYSLRDLTTNDSAVAIGDLNAISDDGRIVGSGNGNDGTHGIVLVPGGGRLNSKGTLIINGSDGDDTITVGLKNDRIRVSINGSLQTFRPKYVKRINISGFAGDDKLTLGAGVPSVGMDGGEGNDTLSAGDASDTLNGGNGNDSLIGYGAKDFLYGGAGNDTLLGGTGIDIFDGGDGTDQSDFDRRETRTNVEGLV